MRDSRVFQVGGRLQSVRDFLRDHPEERSVFQTIDMLLSTVAVVRHGGNGPAPEIDANTDTAFVARVLFGILQRGRASLVSPFVEHSLLDGGICIQDRFTDKDLNPTLAPAAPDGLAERLIAQLLLPESNVEFHALAALDSGAEWTFLRDHLPSLLGHAVSFVEPQRLLSTMLDGHLGQEFAEQRVDFALQTPTTRIVFEIDGDLFHRGAQRDLDARRDRSLSESGWTVERIPAREVFAGPVTFSARMRQAVEKDRALCALTGTRLGTRCW